MIKDSVNQNFSRERTGLAVLLGWIRAKLTLTVNCELMLLNIMNSYFYFRFANRCPPEYFPARAAHPIKGRRTLSFAFYCGGGN